MGKSIFVGLTDRVHVSSGHKAGCCLQQFMPNASSARAREILLTSLSRYYLLLKDKPNPQASRVTVDFTRWLEARWVQVVIPTVRF